MHRPFTLSCAGALTAAAVLLTGSPASAAPDTDYFVVNTQFWEDPSPIVDAGGVFADCEEVRDLGGTAEQIKPNTLLFAGDKLVLCPEGEVSIHYNATLNGSGKRTSGHWFVTDSTLPGVTDGFGTVRGDTRCTIVEGSEGCILDTFSGTTE